MSVIGLTGGFLSSKAMGAGQLAPSHLQDDTGKFHYLMKITLPFLMTEFSHTDCILGNLMGTCLVAGLLGGASLSFGVLALI